MIAFLLALVGISIGRLLRRTLPADQLSPESKDVTKLSLGIMVTLAAIVLGLPGGGSAKGAWSLAISA